MATCGIFSKSLANRLPAWRVDRFESNRVDSTISPTPLHSYSRNVFQVSCKSTSGMTGRHQLWRVVRFESTRVDSTISSTPFVATRGIFSKCLANRLPVWWVDINCDESFDSITSPTPLLRGIFSKWLANRLPVWRVDFNWDVSSRFDNIFNPI